MKPLIMPRRRCFAARASRSTALAALLAAPAAMAADSELASRLLSLSLDELMNVEITVGARGETRTRIQSPVPVDVITAEQIERTGYAELGKVLQRLLPSFNFPGTAVADGTDHARPFTLRGMGADQVLLLINGKRRHPGALLHLNGTIGRGSSGTDINMIPAAAVARIELLRDGASAQYGSDAIAGIINIVLKGEKHNANISLSAGQTGAGDGEVGQAAFSSGHKVRETGFFQVSGELRARGDTNRSGVDTRPQYFAGDPRNDLPSGVTHRIGDAELQDALLMLNTEIPVSDTLKYYGNASLGRRDGESAGFFRRPLDNRTVREIYPDGFLPRIVPRIQDAGLTLGAKSSTASGWQWDAGYTFGFSDFNFRIDNSLNASLGSASPTNFDSGSLRFSQHLAGLDLVKPVDFGWERPLQVALGAEARWENFVIEAGEEASYSHGGVPVLDGPDAGAMTAAGAQVFPGFKPANATDAKRHNLSAYLDLEYQLSARLLGQAAARFERYSDFGETLNGKLAAAYAANETLTLRTSASTGFRAPALAQSHFTATSTVFLGNEAVEVGTFNVDHPLARALGAVDLKAESSYHSSAGFSYRAAGRKLVLSADAFFTRIDDRIILSGDIYQNPDIYGQAATDILRAYGAGGARFFTNAIDTETYGFDLALNYEWELPAGRLNLSTQYHADRTRIVGDVRAPEILGVNGGDIVLNRAQRVQRVESGQPRDSLILSAVYQYYGWDLRFRWHRVGAYKLVNYLDNPEYDQTVSAAWLTDVDLAWRMNNAWEWGIGAHNLFDVYPDANLSRADDPFSGADKIIPYSPNAPFGYNGAYYYLRVKYRF